MKLKFSLFLLFYLAISIVSAKPLDYQLGITIDPVNQQLAGRAIITAQSDMSVQLSVAGLQNVEVAGYKTVINNQLIALDLQSEQTLTIDYTVNASNESGHFIDENNVFLTKKWYPQPNRLAFYQLSAQLPQDFIAVSEYETCEVEQSAEQNTFYFNFPHVLENIHLIASKNFAVKKEKLGDINIEAYFFKQDIALADKYLEHSKRYLAMYNKMLTPYPYKRFAIVENIFPTGYAMPTFTLLGQHVLKLPFIVESSLGHEILHSWFGNSVFNNFEQGNWVEGITTYLADHYYKELENQGHDYRKTLLINYAAYVDENNTLAVKDFVYRNNRVESAVGYNKSAMIFHMLRQQFGDEKFFAAVKHFLKENIFKVATWQDIQTAFEKVTETDLQTFFTQWITRKDIPKISVEDAHFFVAQGQIIVEFTVLQHTEKPYYFKLPVTVYSDSDVDTVLLDIDKAQQTLRLTLDTPPTKVVIDENYDVMRHLTAAESPPVLANILYSDKAIAVFEKAQTEIYQPLITGLGITDIETKQEVKLTEIRDNDLIVAADHPIVDLLFAGHTFTDDDVQLRIYKNPYNTQKYILLVKANNVQQIEKVSRKLSHYGKYSQLAFNDGKNTQKQLLDAVNGITILSHPPAYVVQPDKTVTLNTILPNLVDNRIIYVGEQHDQFAHHLNQLAVIKYLHDNGHKVAIGLEMFQRPYQQALDEYVGEMSDEKTFLEESHYFTKWRFDYNLYKPIIDYAKKAGLPLIALNIEGEVNSQVAQMGIAELEKDHQLHLPQSMDFSIANYRHDLQTVFSFHQKMAHGHANFDHFLQAQTVWDEMMAQSIDEFLQTNPKHKMVVLAGNGHLRYKYGIPKRVYRRNGEPYVVILQDDILDESIADYVLMTETIKGKTAPKLGIMLEEIEDGITVIDVMQDSPAAQINLQPDDFILTINEQPIETLFDLKYSLFYLEKGQTVTITILRDGEEIVQDITF